MAEDYKDVNVDITYTLTKEQVIWSTLHVETEWDVDPNTGRRVATDYMEFDDLKNAYEEGLEYTLMQALVACQRIIQKLREDGIALNYYAGENLSHLAEACEGWKVEELTVYEHQEE